MEVVIVSASWCGNCPSVKENLKDICQSSGLELKELDFDNDFENVKSLGVRSLPTIIFNGKSISGVKTKQELKEFLEV